ncbi:Conserved_hypothetical protein [Hexamita inflata]|uniref:Uncharacterized protein n=1 Tax=Hexamita inflata TaxID=28002 RepID=A0AA86RAL5_9EUKA|nr:Conserved hypothetical protein [Hexamita inflata]
MNRQIVMESIVNISVTFQVLIGALLCTICDVEVQQCNLVFIASGQQISGLIIEPKQSIHIQLSYVQYRISSTNSSGLANVIKQPSITFEIIYSKLSGSNLVQSDNNGYIASTIFVNILLNISELYICVDKTQRLGQQSVYISELGSESVQCNMCDKQSIVYGLCSETLKYSEVVNGMYQCVYPFEYVENQCICAYGYLLNETKCINVVESISYMKNQDSNGFVSQLKLLELKVENIEKSFTIIDQSIINSLSDLDSRISVNYSQLDYNLFKNTSTLDNRIKANITSIINDVLSTQITADANLLFNTTVLDWRIFNNASMLQYGINNLTLRLNDFNNSLQQQNQIIQQQKNIIDNLTLQISCTSNYGYSLINGSCVQVTCAIKGQQSINGICQCTLMNQIVQSGQCVCPANTNTVGNACVCSISGQTMINGLCTCQTVGAFVVNESCVCGVNALNISNMCICPTNSTLINNVCTCERITGQQIISGVCQCPSGQSVVSDFCQQTNYIINNTNFECSQEIFVQVFDIRNITNQLNTSSNFNLGYVFSTNTVIQNAFIDISDNIYATTVPPLFQSQNTFTNLKIQLGVQYLNSGSLILSSNLSVSICQMNIVSRPVSQLTVRAGQQFNVLAQSTTTVNITNLLLNLSFAPSSGGITLICNITGILHIFGYQVLGTYISTSAVAMIGIYVSAATVNVNKISFQPSVYNVGNCSSYLFVNALNIRSSLTITDFAVILGNSSNYLLLGSISTSSTNYYQYGGLIVSVNSDSLVSIYNILVDSYQNFRSDYVSYSGILVGYIYSSQSQITINNVCLQQVISTTTQIEFVYMGIIGISYGNLSLHSVEVTFQILTSYVFCFGIIGTQHSSSHAEIINLKTSPIFNFSQGSTIGSIFGFQAAQICSLKNITVVGGNINSNSSYVGGFIGRSNLKTYIQNCSIQYTNISSQNYLGGFIGYCWSTLYLQDSKIQLVHLFSYNNVGIVVGYNDGGVCSFSNSLSASNYINNVLKSDCAVLSSFSVVGC